jgi:hypothetical protein
MLLEHLRLNLIFGPKNDEMRGGRNTFNNEEATTEWKTGVRFPTEAKDFSSSLFDQTSSEAHPASYPMGTRGPFSGDKPRPGRDADHSPTSSTEVLNV